MIPEQDSIPWGLMAFRLHWARHLPSLKNLNPDIILEKVKGLKLKGDDTERGARMAIREGFWEI